MSLQRRSESGRKQAKAPSLGSKTPGTPSQQQLSLLRSSHRSCKTASRFRSLPALEGAHRRPVQTYILPTTYLYPVFYTVSHLRQHRLRYNFPRELPPQQGRGTRTTKPDALGRSRREISAGALLVPRKIREKIVWDIRPRDARVCYLKCFYGMVHASSPTVSFAVFIVLLLTPYCGHDTYLRALLPAKAINCGHFCVVHIGKAPLRVHL